MAFDRAATLRHAEKLLRQGKLDAAIAAYTNVIEQQPTDWNTANALGDLYVRVGQPDRAAEQFTRSADRLTAEGFLAKAAALYKKILKLKPDDEHTLLQAGELAARQGLFVDARAYLAAAAERRSAQGDNRGATDIRIRIDTLDPNDYERRMTAAGLRAERGDTVGAVRDLQDIAKDLGKKRRPADAVAALEQAARLAPHEDHVRGQLVNMAVAAGDFPRARGHATTVEELKALADTLDLYGHHDEAVETLRLVARLVPADSELALRLARAFVARGDAAAAAEFLTLDTARADPPLLLAAADLQLRAGLVDEGLVSVRRFLDEESDGREQIALLSCRLAELAPECGFRALEIATDAAAGRSDWAWAAAALQEFARRAPNYVPALLRLVETCVDAGLESAMYDAQVKLTDAYLAAGAGAEARMIVEDLVDREPWERDHIDRLRRALSLLNEHDPDLAIAARLSAPAPHGAGSAATEPPQADTDPSAIVAKPVAPRKAAARDPQFALGPNAVDIESILGDLDEGEIPTEAGLSSRRLQSPSRPDRGDVDLSLALNEMGPITAPDLDGVFEQLRDEVSRRSAIEAAEADYQRARALYQTGNVDACIAPLQAAARAPTVRFAAASLLGRIFKQRGLIADSIEWFERAAEAPAPTPSESHDVLYELADALESIGEMARALAVWLELQTEAGPYRDVAARIDRLVKVKARG